MRILIAEDDMISMDYIHKMLSQYGECDLVMDGLEALNTFQLSMSECKPYDLICLDIMMPKVNGVKVLQHIRDYEIHQRIPLNERSKIIIITALAETQMVKNAFEFGCNAYIQKPFDSTILYDKLKQLDLII